MAVPGRSKLAVMFTDVVGFTSIMERNEKNAMGILSRIEELLHKWLDLTDGSMVKAMGDGTLSVFSNPLQAVDCARELQKSLHDDDFKLRVGIHWGDVLHDRGDVFGDTVNVASRLEKIAAPGGICISREILNNYSDTSKPAVECLGLHKLKGLGRLIELYLISISERSPQQSRVSQRDSELNSPVSSGEIPAVAVTLLNNLGSDRDSFYAYGISSDLVSDLARAGSITVAPLSDVMSLQGSENFANLLVEKFNSRFLVKGSLWKEKSVFRLSVELQDIRENRLIWADNWQDDWYELPAIKGKLADSLLKAMGIEPSLFPGMTGIACDQTSAYELYLKGRHLYQRRSSTSDLRKSRKVLQSAIEMDPELVLARVFLGGTFRDAGEYLAGREILEEALVISRRTGNQVGQLQALNGIGVTLWKQSYLNEAGDVFKEVLDIAGRISDRDGQARALNNLGLIEWNQGRLNEALDYFTESLSIARQLAACMQQAYSLCNIGLVHASAGNENMALDFYQKSLDLAVSSGNLDAQAHILINMANARFRTDEIEKAISIGQRCLHICRELDDRPGECKVLNNFGNMMLHLGCFDSAREYYREALIIAEAQDDRLMIGIIQSGTGLLEVENGNPEAGIQNYQKSLEICRKMDDAEGESEMLFQLGEANILQGSFEEAIANFRESIRIREEIGTTSRSSCMKALLSFAILSSQPSIDEEESLSLLRSAESELVTQHRRDESDTLIILADVYRLLLHRRGESIRGKGIHAKKYRTLVEAAHESLMSSAERLQTPSYREAFINNLERHRNISAAYAELKEE